MINYTNRKWPLESYDWLVNNPVINRTTEYKAMKKTMSFAVMHFAVAFGVAYFLTGSIVVGGLVALVEPACNTVAFYFHDKLWARLEQNNSNTHVAA